MFTRFTLLTAATLLLASTLATPPAQAAPPAAAKDDEILAKMPLFPKDSLWNQDISQAPVDPNSDKYIALIGPNKPLHPDFGTKYGIPFQFVDSTTPRYHPKFEYADESDKGPYPIPDQVKIEGLPGAKDGDRHILCIDKSTWDLYELWNSEKTAQGWTAGSGAIFNLTKNPSRPKGWTSADAAGLPIFPGLVRYDEVHLKKAINHAVRFTIDSTSRGYVAPATHFAPHHTKPGSPPMGIRVRLKATVDISHYPPDVQVILTCLKKYGMILADNGSDWFISGAPDDRWDDEPLQALKKIKGKDLEVIKLTEITTK